MIKNFYEVDIDVDLKSFIPEYIKNKKNMLEQIESLLTVKNFNKIREIAHNLKGTGASYGFDYITEIGKNISEHSKNCETEEIISDINKLKDYLKKLKINYIQID
jgi:HPt (histidine-containing phosphotransfer) domain-containing protein